jgi:hypothetical protein
LPSAFFSINGAPALTPISNSYFAARAFPQAGLQWNYPLVRRGEEVTTLIEPVAAIYAGPAAGNRRRIPNEDSLSFE